MVGTRQFALNHMCAPELGLEKFFDLARSLDIRAVEIRNDIPGLNLYDTDPIRVRAQATSRSLKIVSINALQRFNEWTDERAREAGQLIDYAVACGAHALVLVPTNDGTGTANGERQANLRVALNALAPMFDSAGIIGLVEPLGFVQSSLRLKSEAADAIHSLGSPTFALVHDTFHHRLAGEETIFAEITGLVHLSGVTDPSLHLSDMRDSHRVLVDSHDRIGNTAQIRHLAGAGYAGCLSFEPFAPSVRESADIGSDLRRSIDYITGQLEARSA